MRGMGHKKNQSEQSTCVFEATDVKPQDTEAVSVCIQLLYVLFGECEGWTLTSILLQCIEKYKQVQKMLLNEEYLTNYLKINPDQLATFLNSKNPLCSDFKGSEIQAIQKHVQHKACRGLFCSVLPLSIIAGGERIDLSACKSDGDEPDDFM